MGDGDPDLNPVENGDTAGTMSFLGHLDELRKRLIWAIASIGVGFAITFPFINRIFDFILRPMQRLLPAGQTLIYTDPSEAFTLEMDRLIVLQEIMRSGAVLAV